jgi:C4-dicarboxylate transporter DctM subunit
VSGAVTTEEIAPPIPALARLERVGLSLVLGAMVVLPVLAVVARWLGVGNVASANIWVQNLNLVLAFLGAVIAARTGRHLALSTGELLGLNPGLQRRLQRGTTAVTVAVTALLAVASWQFVQAEMASASTLPGGVPRWAIQGFMPGGFALMAAYLAWTRNPDWLGRSISVAATAGIFALALVPPDARTPVVWIGSIVLMGSVALGAPIYTVMGGLAMLFFYGQPIPVPIAAVPLETFTLVASPTLPAIPLFTLAGYLLAEGGASKRLVGLFREWFGWMPGGIAAAAVLVCAFFTTFTGASGVTILALGGLLLPILVKAGYSERFSIGLLIASGSIGLLFPPSLPVILYGVVAQVPIDTLFVAGAVPGTLLVLLVVAMGVVHATRRGVKRTPFDAPAAAQALWSAKWEAAMPALVLVGIFGGFLTIFEAAAFTAAYALLTEVVIHRDIHWKKDLGRVFVECGTLMGGVMIILGLALGFTNYLIDAEIPMRMTAWAEAHVGGRLMFLLLLNIFLLVVGCLMDIFSAIVVVVPLIIPMGAAFGVHPVHLGILFLANLELGYLTPPVGMNLFLASYRFERPLTQVYGMAFPFLTVLLVGVLTIAYIPGLTTWAIDPDDASGKVDFDAELAEPRSAGDGAPAALPLGEMDLDALLSGDGELDAKPAAKPAAPGGDGKAGALPLGTLDLDALLSGDDDTASDKGDDASSKP